MKIEVLGTGCAKCEQLYANVEQAVREARLDAEVSKVTDLRAIIRRGVMLTPAIAVDGIVRSSGKVLTPAEIRGLFT